MPNAQIRGVQLHYRVFGERGHWVALVTGGRRGRPFPRLLISCVRFRRGREPFAMKLALFAFGLFSAGFLLHWLWWRVWKGEKGARPEMALAYRRETKRCGNRARPISLHLHHHRRDGVNGVADSGRGCRQGLEKTRLD